MEDRSVWAKVYPASICFISRKHRRLLFSRRLCFTDFPANTEQKEKGLIKKDDGSVLIRRPVKTLPAAVTKLLVLPFHRYTALRTYRKAVASMKAAETVDTANPHGTAKQHGAVRFRNQKLIGRLLKSRAQLFQGIDRRSRFAPCDIPKISGAEAAALRCCFVRKLTFTA